MAESETSRPTRASLRGKGRSILLGPQDDAAQPASAVVPQQETWPCDSQPAASVPDRPLYEAPGPPIGEIQPPNAVEDAPDLDDPREGGLMFAPPAAEASASPEWDPFGSGAQRERSIVLFQKHTRANPDLVDRLVDDATVIELWQQIGALHEELINEVRGDRFDTDTYLGELLDASGKLLEKRENYDDARAIYNRIRADLQRRRKVEADIARYRPRLLKYYLIWGVLWAVVMLTGQALIERIGLFPPADVPVFFYPVMFGVLGALVSGYLTLDRHTTHLRDFDPLHESWYVFNPPLGAVMGLLMLLLYAIVNQDVLLPGAAQPMEQAVVWLLCALAGMNQHAVLRHMFRLLDRLATGGK